MQKNKIKYSRKLIAKMLIILTFLTQFISCKFGQTECEQFCEKPNRREIFEKFPIEKQFDYYRTCLCWGNSISEKYYWGETLLKHEDIMEFLIHTLKTETNPDILTDSIELLSYTVDTKYNLYGEDIKGRTDISELVNKTVAKIPDKDERDFMDKLTGEKVKSRKEKLVKLSKEIEEKTDVKSENSQKQ